MRLKAWLRLSDYCIDSVLYPPRIWRKRGNPIPFLIKLIIIPFVLFSAIKLSLLYLVPGKTWVFIAGLMLAVLGLILVPDQVQVEMFSRRQIRAQYCDPDIKKKIFKEDDNSVRYDSVRYEGTIFIPVLSTAVIFLAVPVLLIYWLMKPQFYGIGAKIAVSMIVFLGGTIFFARNKRRFPEPRHRIYFFLELFGAIALLLAIMF